MPSVQLYSVKLVKEKALPFRAAFANNSEKAAKILSGYLKDRDREHFVVLAVDTKLHPVGLHTVAVGTLDKVHVSPREVFKFALLSNAGGIILAHNHPSGDPTPSSEDLFLTKLITEVGKKMEIRVLDHIIVTSNRKKWISMREAHIDLFE
jgi:DNA repair protein RadC